MSNFRMDKNTTEHYTSFKDLAKAWGCKEFTMQTKDKNKLEKQRENFRKKHICKGCGMPMEYFPYGGNTMVCRNSECKGIKDERVDREGNTYVVWLPSFRILDDRGAMIAQNVFM